MAKTELNIVINGNSVSAQKALKMVNKNLKDTEGKAKRASGSLKTFKLGWIAAAAGIAVAVRALKGFVDAAAKQEDADNKLAASLKAVGEFTEGTFNKMATFADEMQRITVVGDEEVQMLQAKALALGVNTSQMEDAIKGSIGLSSALGIDVNSALRMVATSLQGDTTLLKRYIPELREAKTEAEATAIVNRKMAEGFDIAKAQTETFSGKMKQLNNATGDLKEIFGKELITAMMPAIEAITTFVQSEEGMLAVKNAARGLVTAFVVLFATIRTLTNSIEIAVQSVIGFTTAVAAWIGNIKNGFGEAQEAFAEKWDAMREQNAADVEDINSTWREASVVLKDIWSEEEVAFEEKLQTQAKSQAKSDKVSAKRQKQLDKDKAKRDAAEKKRLDEMAALKKRFAEAGVRSVIDAASAEKATFGSVAAAFVKSQADALSEVLTMKAIAAAVSGNFIGAAAFTAAAIGVKLAGGKFAQAVGGKTQKFADGGIIDEPVIGIGQRSGNRFVFGEAGTETATKITPEGQGGGGDFFIETLIVQANDPVELAEAIAENKRRLGIQDNKR